MLVESAPKLIREGVTKLQAEAIKTKIEAAGAKVTVKSGNGPIKGTGRFSVAPGDETAVCDVILLEMGANKIAVIKEVREAVPGLGLAEAKMLVETAPQPIKRGVAKAEAHAIQQRVEAAGAKVVIK